MDVAQRMQMWNGLGIVAIVIFIRERVGDFGPIHGLHERLDFVGAHHDAVKRICRQNHADKEIANPVQHGAPPVPIREEL